MKSKVGKPLSQLKEEVKKEIDSSELETVSDPIHWEMIAELDAQKELYEKLTPEEIERWDDIKVLLQLRDDERISMYKDLLSEETERANSYHKASLMSAAEFEQYLIGEIRELDLKITKHSFGRELLEHFSQEKFLLLFNDVNHYKPLNLRIKEHYEKKDEREIKDKLIKLFAKERALMDVLMKLEVKREDNPVAPVQESKKKPGRKKTDVNETFSLKDVATPEQIEVIIKLLEDNLYIEKVDGKYFLKDEKAIYRFASIIKALPKYNYCSHYISKQAFYIIKNDFNGKTTQATVNQAKDARALSIFSLKR